MRPETIAAPAAAVVVAVMLSSSCSSDDRGGREEDGPLGAAELAGRLGCERTAPAERMGFDDERPVECYAEEGWVAAIHAPLDRASRSAAVTLLGSRSEPDGLSECPHGTPYDDVSVVAGDSWIVVVTSDAGADQVLDRLGGETQPANSTGPPVSYFSLPVLPCP